MQAFGGTGSWRLGCVCVLVACSSSSASPSPAGGGRAGTTVGSSGAHSLGGGGAGGALGASGGSGRTAHAGGSAGAGGFAGAGVCAHEFANAACWQEKSLQTVTNIEQAFFGAVFDGRNLVYANEASGPMSVQARFDTLDNFTGDSAWCGFDAVALKVRGFRGGAFDGRYVYLTPFAPEENGARQQTYDSVAVRYGSQAAFTTGTSWSSIT